jgi:hypothetical protein
MCNKFFFSWGVCVTLVLLASLTACSRFPFFNLFLEKDSESEFNDDHTPNSPGQPNPPPPPVVSPNYTWYVSFGGNDSNTGVDDSSPLATVQAALTRINAVYQSGNWPAGVSAVIVVSGRITAQGSFGSRDAMVNVSGSGRYPHIILEGDPTIPGVLDANRGKNGNGDGWVLYIRNNKVTLGKGLTLTGGHNLWGGAVCVGMHGSDSDGEFILDGGEISGNIGSYGGAVIVYKGSMTMLSGLIKNNSNDFNNNPGGGGIYVFSDAALYLYGGTIKDNGNVPITGKGGGLFIEGRGTVYMTGGDILNNTSHEQGGGVYVASLGVFYMVGGRISGNKSGTDGGVGVGEYSAVFKHTGGTISGNTP